MRFGSPAINEEFLKVDHFANLFILRPWSMTALHLNFNTQLGPDHYFHVVPGVSESSLAAKGGYLHRHGGYRAHVTRSVIAPVTLVTVC